VVKVNAALQSQGDVASFSITPNSAKVVYRADQSTDTVDELYSTAFRADADGDGILGVCDDCPNAPDPSQTDTDGDGVGDACDNCPALANPGQQDTETAAGPDLTCGTTDDWSGLYGPDNTCGTSD